MERGPCQNWVALGAGWARRRPLPSSRSAIPGLGLSDFRLREGAGVPEIGPIKKPDGRIGRDLGRLAHTHINHTWHPYYLYRAPSSSGSATKTYRDRQAPTLSQITQEAGAAGGFQASSSYIFSSPLKPLSLTSGLSTCSSTFLVCPGLLMLHNTREVGISDSSDLGPAASSTTSLRHFSPFVLAVRPGSSIAISLRPALNSAGPFAAVHAGNSVLSSAWISQCRQLPNLLRKGSSLAPSPRVELPRQGPNQVMGRGRRAPFSFLRIYKHDRHCARVANTGNSLTSAITAAQWTHSSIHPFQRSDMHLSTFPHAPTGSYQISSACLPRWCHLRLNV